MRARWLALLLGFFLLLVTLQSPAVEGAPTTLVTRYGQLRAIPAVTTPDQFDLFLNGKLVSSINALGVSFYRVTPKGENEYLIIDSSLSGLNCVHEFRVLQVAASGSYSLSHAFGECTDLTGADNYSDHVVIKTADHLKNGHQQKTHSYRVKNGEITSVKTR